MHGEERWSDFLVTEVGASATLTGLHFVADSMRVR
jgi:hypothetical protein